MKSFSQKIISIIGFIFLLIGIGVNALTLGITNGIFHAMMFCFNLLFISVGILLIKYHQRILKEIILLFVTLFCLFFIIEGYYRAVDPFPYFGYWEINTTDHGTLSRYDEMLGWSGVPNGKEVFVTMNNRIVLQNNSMGFRDIEHHGAQKPAIVFLGDSFTWGYEVAFDDMFVNRLREKLPNDEIFNLAHRGYGTDQELLTFKQWPYGDKIKFVILMFSENDFLDNNSKSRYSKEKPKYELVDDSLVLTNVPVANDKNWKTRNNAEKEQPSFNEKLKWLIFRSHFIHDISFRAKNIKKFKETAVLDNKQTPKIAEDDAYVLTKHIIAELKKETEGRNARLIVVATPSKRQFIYKTIHVPYQLRIEKICRDLKIDYLDLSPYFENRYQQLYFRYGMHINKYGNKIIAAAIYDYLIKPVVPLQMAAE
jgi:lysophospholipase L1-like esterase